MFESSFPSNVIYNIPSPLLIPPTQQFSFCVKLISINTKLNKIIFNFLCHIFTRDIKSVNCYSIIFPIRSN